MSGYPDYMQESIRLVEKTRSERLEKGYPLMSAEEKSEILKKWHPDYKEGTKRLLKIGPSAGQLMPHEVADILEAHPIINPKDIDLTDISFDLDILIIGAGGAGLSAALLAHESGIDPDRILMVQKLRLGDANSKMSQGGIQAADGTDDSPTRHFLDIMGGGRFTNKPELVEVLVKEGPDVIKWHESLGVMYDKNPDGTMKLEAGGGTSRRRMHSCKDYTGLEITRVLVDEFLNREIPYVEFTAAVELLMDDKGQVAGSVLFNMDSDEYLVAKAKSTILATGGFGRLHIQGYETTNHYGATADGLPLAYHVGAYLRDLDSTQFHPTGAAYPEQIVGQLATEMLRSRGAQPVNKFGQLFVHSLETRDAESSAIIRECYERNNGIITPTGMRGVWLDTPLIDLIHGSGTIEREFSAMYRMWGKFDIDIRREPMLVFPTLHYQNGGVEINTKCETSVPGLYAAGEVCGGVHGKNRLMGNSQLDLYVFGRRAGRFAAERAKKIEIGKLTLDHVYRYERWLSEAGIKTDRRAPLILPEYRGKRTLEHKIKIL
ncbi:FAD-binding protein [Candidatus Bathyarchaeota archaeon]|nr:FAD-binding protein [Candidatus Bathyarchaeota archaeon]